MLFFSVLTDLIHLLKMSVFSDFFFQFRKKEGKNRYIIIFFTMMVTSIALYVLENEFIETVAYIIIICVAMCILYNEKIYIKIIAALWILLITSLIDVMFSMLMWILMDMTQIQSNASSDTMISIISFLFVLVIGNLYEHKYKRSIKDIGIGNFILFTILVVVDTFVALMVAVVAIKEVKSDLKILFSIAVILVILGILLQLAAVILLFVQRNIYKEKEQLTEKYLNEQKNHYEYLEKREKETKKFRHDLRNHIHLLLDLSKNKKYEEFDEYTKKINIKIDSFGNYISVNNGIVDAIINRYYSEAVHKNIDMNVNGMFPKDCNIDAYDLCTIFSNVLSNALEATVKADNKKINLDCRYEKNNIIIVVKNTFVDVDQFKDGKFTTNKADLDYHGYGLDNIKDSVEKNNGVIDIEVYEDVFQVMIMLEC